MSATNGRAKGTNEDSLVDLGGARADARLRRVARREGLVAAQVEEVKRKETCGTQKEKASYGNADPRESGRA